MIIPEELLKYSYPLKYETTGHKLWGAAMVQKSQFSNSCELGELESTTEANIQKSWFYNFPVLFRSALGSQIIKWGSASIKASPSPNQSQVSQARTGLTVTYKVGICISVQSERSIHVNMWRQ